MTCQLDLKKKNILHCLNVYKYHDGVAFMTPVLKRAPCLVYCFAVAILRLLRIYLKKLLILDESACLSPGEFCVSNDLSITPSLCLPHTSPVKTLTQPCGASPRLLFPVHTPPSLPRPLPTCQHPSCSLLESVCVVCIQELCGPPTPPLMSPVSCMHRNPPAGRCALALAICLHKD